MKTVAYLLFILFLTGCSAKSYLEDIPNAEFTRFEYHRAGNVTSAHLVAENSVREDGILMIEKVAFTGDYGPAFNVNIKLEGYIRDKNNDEESILP